MLEPKYEVIAITPDIAEELLLENNHNRPLRVSVIDAYARDMRNGNWQEENGESIKIAEDGTIIDGQHRLEAIILAGVTLRTLVVSNLPMSVQETLDAGARRSFSDVLKLRGKANYSTLATVTRAAWLWETVGWRNQGHMKPTHAQLISFLDAHPELEATASAADKIRKSTPLPGSIAGLCHWLFAKINQVDCNDFFEKLIAGANLPEGSPILALSRSLKPGRDSRFRLSDVIMLAYTIKAWNAYRDGREVQLLRFVPGGANPEKFPEPR